MYTKPTKYKYRGHKFDNGSTLYQYDDTQGISKDMLINTPNSILANQQQNSIVLPNNYQNVFTQNNTSLPTNTGINKPADNSGNNGSNNNNWFTQGTNAINQVSPYFYITDTANQWGANAAQRASKGKGLWTNLYNSTVNKAVENGATSEAAAKAGSKAVASKVGSIAGGAATAIQGITEAYQGWNQDLSGDPFSKEDAKMAVWNTASDNPLLYNPNVSAWSNLANNYKDYVDSLDKVGFNSNTQSMRSLGREWENQKMIDLNKSDLDKSIGRQILDYNVATGKGALIGLAAGGPWGALAGAFVGSGLDLFNKYKANKNKNKILATAKEADQRMYQQALNRRDIITEMNNRRDMINYSALGGKLFDQGGTMLNKFETGGSHEENPYGGILQGVAPDGQPNLVEQGETKWNDENYIFSKRLKVNKQLAREYNLPKEFIGKSFADATSKFDEKFNEHENDVLSIATQNAILTRASEAQEALRANEMMKQLNEQMANLTPEEQQTLLMQMQQQPMETQQMQYPIGSENMQGGMPQGYALGGHMFGGDVPQIKTTANGEKYITVNNTKYYIKSKEALDYFSNSGTKLTPELVEYVYKHQPGALSVTSEIEQAKSDQATKVSETLFKQGYKGRALENEMKKYYQNPKTYRVPTKTKTTTAKKEVNKPYIPLAIDNFSTTAQGYIPLNTTLPNSNVEITGLPNQEFNASEYAAQQLDKINTVLSHKKYKKNYTKEELADLQKQKQFLEDLQAGETPLDFQLTGRNSTIPLSIGNIGTNNFNFVSPTFTPPTVDSHTAAAALPNLIQNQLQAQANEVVQPQVAPTVQSIPASQVPSFTPTTSSTQPVEAQAQAALQQQIVEPTQTVIPTTTQSIPVNNTVITNQPVAPEENVAVDNTMVDWAALSRNKPTYGNWTVDTPQPENAHKQMFEKALNDYWRKRYNDAKTDEDFQKISEEYNEYQNLYATIAQNAGNKEWMEGPQGQAAIKNLQNRWRTFSHNGNKRGLNANVTKELMSGIFQTNNRTTMSLPDDVDPKDLDKGIYTLIDPDGLWGVQTAARYMGITDPELLKLYAEKGVTFEDYAPGAWFTTSKYAKPSANAAGTLTEGTRETPELLPTWMRGVGALLPFAFLGQKSDYSNADMIQAPKIGFSPIADYLKYRPLDKQYYLNTANAKQQNLRNNIINLSGGNRAAAANNLMLADLQAQDEVGKLYRMAEEYNADQRAKVAAQNADVNKFNSNGFFGADQWNANAEFQARQARAQMRHNIDVMTAQAKGANLTQGIQNLVDIGNENARLNMIASNPALVSYIDKNFGIKYKAPTTTTEGIKSRNGGYLTIKKRRING